MTMNLEPINDIDAYFSCPIAFWSWLMFDAGVGHPISLERHETDPTQFYYVPDENNHCPMFNDGYVIAQDLAIAMSMIAEAAIERFPDREKELRRFANFSIISGGFRIL